MIRRAVESESYADSCSAGIEVQEAPKSVVYQLVNGSLVDTARMSGQETVPDTQFHTDRRAGEVRCPTPTFTKFSIL